MGRTEPSVGIAPQAHRKDVRAKLAKSIINKTIPAIVSRNARAAAGIRDSQLITDPPAPGTKRAAAKDVIQQKNKAESHEAAPAKGKSKSKSKTKKKSLEFNDEEGVDKSPIQHHARKSSKPVSKSKTRANVRIRIISTDTLTAAQLLSPPKHSHKDPNPHSDITLLNMASPLRPGGGVLTGATSQEEFLCARTTLLPSLHEDFYRLPPIGGILTLDVLVFRGPGSLDTSELPKTEWWWADVVSAGMLRFPDVVEDETGERRYASEKDRGIVREMMRAVMRICVQAGRKRVVLGAWGCGAYGNPIMEVSRAWKEVLLEGVESWEPVEEVVFAISERRMAREFAGWFGESIEVEGGTRLVKSKGESEAGEDEELAEEQDKEELKVKITDLEARIKSVKIRQLQSTLETILMGMKKQLADRESIKSGGSEDGALAVLHSGNQSRDHEDEDDVEGDCYESGNSNLG